MEPKLRCTAAIYSPTTGIVDIQRSVVVGSVPETLVQTSNVQGKSTCKTDVKQVDAVLSGRCKSKGS